MITFNLRLLESRDFQWEELDQFGQDLHDTGISVSDGVDALLSLDGLDDRKDKGREILEESHSADGGAFLELSLQQPIETVKGQPRLCFKFIHESFDQ